MLIQENVYLSPFTTLKVGGTARYFIDVSSVDMLAEAFHYIKTTKQNFFILGAGSNILIADSGFDGCVIRIAIQGVEIEEVSEDECEVVAGAGESWDALVEYTVNKGLWGIENLSLIPGSVGGAVVQNIGAYGSELKDVVQWVEVYDRKEGLTRKLTRKDCEFGYRTSIFKKQDKHDYIITRVCFLLATNAQPNTTYKDVASYIEKHNLKNITLDAMRAVILAIRTNKFPRSKSFGSAGSFFMNPVIMRAHYMILKWKYPGIPGFYTDDGVKVSAAWIIDNVCHLKGLRVGDVGLYENQPLVFVTSKNARAEDVRRLAQLVQKEVYAKTKIHLVPEVVFVGFEK